MTKQAMCLLLLILTTPVVKTPRYIQMSIRYVWMTLSYAFTATFSTFTSFIYSMYFISFKYINNKSNNNNLNIIILLDMT